ncbi:hypothetical protein WMY93_026616 [Mugilogobius chulae]|uniref:IRG-type G domain-containing protein n=1 Tax=Mugilogobius chulae TaxID=88201 RepID=A0AAW0N2C6_9GOBI
MADVLKSLNLLETLKESIDTNKLTDVKDTVEDLLISRINIGVVGDRCLEKTTFLNSLRGLGIDDEGAAVFPSLADPEEVVGHPDPKHTDFRLWDLPSVPATSPFTPESYMDKYKFMRYNAVFMTFTDIPQINSVTVFLEARSLQNKTVYFVILDSDKKQTSLDRRKASLEVLTSQGVAVPKVYIVNPSCLEKMDFPVLLDDMGQDLPEIRPMRFISIADINTSPCNSEKRGI